jgi:GDPmannose 4,6-dehydratase
LTRILVTGASGQDGTLLVRRLLADGHDVHALTLSGQPHGDQAGSRDGPVRFHEGDLADIARTQQIVMDVAPQEIYNLAGQSSVARSWDEPVETLATTGLGAAAVFDAALRLQDHIGTEVRVFQASSAEIFGSADHAPQTEATAIRPVSPYGAAKALAHHMARISRTRGLFVATGILYNHESPLRPTTFVTRKITSEAARLSVEGGEPLRLGNLDATRDWGWAEDYVDAMIRACRHHEADDFVVATGKTHSVADFVRVAFARAGITEWRDHVEVDARFVRPTEATVQVGDASKAARELGWTPSVSFDEVVERMVDHDLMLARARAATA